MSMSDSFMFTLLSDAPLSIMSSASLMIIFMALRDSMGYFPAAVSPLSITASAPSKTAVPTSVTSARVGRGFLYVKGREMREMIQTHLR